MVVFLRLLLFMLVLIFVQTHKHSVEEDFVTSGNNSDELVETQHTICQINTQQLAATAKATVTRALKGVCLGKYMDEHFRKIEKFLKNQLEFMKEIDSKIGSVLLDRFKKTEHSSEALIMTTGPPQWDNDAFKETAEDKFQRPVPRELEIKRFNGTVYLDNTKKSVFMYFWKLSKVEEILSKRKSVRSPNFYITPGGYCMYMRLSATQDADTIYIQAGLTYGNFDETLLWPFRLKHKLTLLDQDLVNNIDIQSRMWDPSVVCSSLHWQKPQHKNDNYECVGLAVTNDILHSRSYLYDGSIIIKLTVHLEP